MGLMVVAAAHARARCASSPRRHWHFPPSELHSIQVGDNNTRLCVNFIGLTGPSGVLPRSYAELLIARRVGRDNSAQEFLDLFNHRIVALFWLAWAKHRPEIGRQFGFRIRYCAI